MMALKPANKTSFTYCTRTCFQIDRIVALKVLQVAGNTWPPRYNVRMYEKISIPVRVFWFL